MHIHKPVMLNEVINFFFENYESYITKTNTMNFIDCTFGYGGHTKAILEEANKTNAIVNIVCCDRDIESYSYCSKLSDTNQYNKSNYNIKCIHSKMSDIYSTLSKNISFYGILMDIGFSSAQIDNPERGFSFQKDGELSMEMGCNQLNAAYILNNFDINLIEKILRIYGNERYSKEIANKIYLHRKKNQIKRTSDLKNLIYSVYNREKFSDIDVSTLTFQALRVFVNDEIYELMSAIISLVNYLDIGGKMAIITFQGLEDIVVKSCFKSILKKSSNNYSEEIYKNFGDNAVILDLTKSDDEIMKKIDCTVKALDLQDFWKKEFCIKTKNVVRPSHDEIKKNKRAKCARMRVLERVK